MSSMPDRVQNASPGASPALPRGLRLLGWSGVVPFVAAVAVALVGPAWRNVAMVVFTAYGALILSFLGGTRWGQGLAIGARPMRYVEAVLPSLLGFAAVLLHGSGLAITLLAVGFATWLAIDMRDGHWSPAYRRMRLGISVVVIALHGAWWLVP